MISTRNLALELEVDDPLKKKEDSISMSFEEKLLESLAENSSYVRDWIELERESNYRYMMEKILHSTKKRR
ncbi:hypothetical protein D3C78_649540 [compost metagenome]